MIKYKKNICLLIYFLIFTSIFAFSQGFNAKLLVKYDEKTLTELKNNNSVEFEYLNLYVTKACSFVIMPEKPINYIDLKKIDINTGETIENYIINEEDIKDFNPFLYNIKLNYDWNTFYKVGNTGKMLKVWAEKDIRNEAENIVRYNNYQQKK